MSLHLDEQAVASSTEVQTSISPSNMINTGNNAYTPTPVSRFGMPTEALRFPDTSNPEDNAAIASNLQEAVKSSEHQMILAAIQTTDSRMEAAAKLGISPRTLRYKLAKLKADNGNMAWAA